MQLFSGDDTNHACIEPAAAVRAAGQMRRLTARRKGFQPSLRTEAGAGRRDRAEALAARAFLWPRDLACPPPRPTTGPPRARMATRMEDLMPAPPFSTLRALAEVAVLQAFEATRNSDPSGCSSAW